MKRTYSSSLFFAIIPLFLIATLSSCSSHKNEAPALIPKPSPIEQPVEQPMTPPEPTTPAPVSMQEVTDLLLLAQQEGQLDHAIDALQRLSDTAPSPVQEEAAFRRVQLLLEHGYANADIEANYELMQHPDHELIPYTHFWLAEWWQAQEPVPTETNTIDNAFVTVDSTYADHVLDELTAALRHPQLTPELMQRSIILSHDVLNRASPEHATPWYFAAAHADQAHREYWMQVIGKAFSLADIKRLHRDHVISPEQDGEVYLHYARQQLMAGNISELQGLAQLLHTDAPQLPITQQIDSWIFGNMHDINVGVLLPLTGHYARFGMQALNGIRLATESQGTHIHLFIQDTAQQPIETAYQQLQAQQVDWIIGPLLSQDTEKLSTILATELPVLSLSMEGGLAKSSPALFMHNLSHETQARFMASYAWSQGLRRMAVIHGALASEQRESDAFIRTLTELGGEIADDVTLEAGSVNHLSSLQSLRQQSDDEYLLHELIVNRELLSPERDLEIHLPPNMDGIYLALNGKQVSELSGQLAYVDIRSIPLLGSNRWMDGHLLDDRGRNLSSARFIKSDQNQQSSELLQRFQETWGEGKPSKLFTVAYDSAHIAILLGSRLGLQGEEAIAALHDAEGFPSESGHVRFNAQGLGEKTFSIHRIEREAIVPAD